MELSLDNDEHVETVVLLQRKTMYLSLILKAHKHFMFTADGDKIRNKYLKNYFDVSVVVDIKYKNTNDK